MTDQEKTVGEVLADALEDIRPPDSAGPWEEDYPCRWVPEQDPAVTLEHQERQRKVEHAAEHHRDGVTVGIEVNDGEMAVIALGLAETATKAQRQHAREVLRSWIGQAMDAVADRLGHRPRGGE